MSTTVSVDTNVGAAYIQFTDEPVAKTIEETPSVQVDLDATGTVVGVEVLDLTAELPIQSLMVKYRFAAPAHTLALVHIRPTIQAYLYSAGAGQANVPALQAV